MSDGKEIFDYVVNGGAFAVLVAAGFGLYKIARDVVPSFRDWLASDTKAKLGMVEQLTAISERVEGVGKRVDGVGDKVDQVGQNVTRAADVHAAGLGQLQSNFGADLTAAEHRITADVWRERERGDLPPSSTRAPKAGVR